MTKLEELSPELQELLIKISNTYDVSDIKNIADKNIIFEDDLDIDDFDNDIVIEKAIEICDYSPAYSNEVFNEIIGNVDHIDIDNIVSLIKDNSGPNVTKKLLEMYSSNNSNECCVINTQEDEYKYKLVAKLFNKYSLLELENKINKYL